MPLLFDAFLLLLILMAGKDIFKFLRRLADLPLMPCSGNCTVYI
jgi:hypothetical protein